jgi:hypothetical protein
MHADVTAALKDSTEIFALDLVKLQAWYRFESKVLHIAFSALYPDMLVQLRPMDSIKIVATPLSQELYRSSTGDLRSGVLTMDTGHRLVPLTTHDSMLASYPCVGMWVSGLGPAEDCLSHPFVWAALVCFTQLTQVKMRLSSDADEYRFVLLSFGKSMKFFEAQVMGSNGPICWRVISRSCSVPLSQKALPYSVVFTPDLPSFGNLTPQSSIGFDYNSPDTSGLSALQLCDLAANPPDCNIVGTLEKQASEIKDLKVQVQKLSELVLSLTPCRACRCSSAVTTPDSRKLTPPAYSPVVKTHPRTNSFSRTGSTYDDELALLKSLRLSRGPLGGINLSPSKQRV